MEISDTLASLSALFKEFFISLKRSLDKDGIKSIFKKVEHVRNVQSCVTMSGCGFDARSLGGDVMVYE
ncbi:hypothetical protein RRG08_043284 [Elysia crispata]|uniref:Uncharacterized protein n=1 Tax=Elysia crispata TaxID=231223 RepID=A0AAE0XXZ8_9GAST|nr:hypothetical protein RRG08_043284 [Elysia crispata]